MKQQRHVTEPVDGLLKVFCFEQYAGFEVRPDAEISRTIAGAVAEIDEFKSRELGATVSTDMSREERPDSAIGNLFTQILLDASGSADIAIHNTVGGIRANLPAGPVTYGEVFELFPFDNRVVLLSLSGAEVKEVFRSQLQSGNWRAGVAGAHEVQLDQRDGHGSGRCHAQ